MRTGAVGVGAEEAAGANTAARTLARLLGRVTFLPRAGQTAQRRRVGRPASRHAACQHTERDKQASRHGATKTPSHVLGKIRRRCHVVLDLGRRRGDVARTRKVERELPARHVVIVPARLPGLQAPPPKNTSSGGLRGLACMTTHGEGVDAGAALAVPCR